ncbi:MAG: mitochondrial fission ELM1 family protein [Alphaproteobacteria bacterium]|nr:mitochondrial fission ELM1 family protein [Alphaproteobacteria bacterium]
MAQDHFATFAQARTAWVVSDGTKGMEVQSLGLAERMGLNTTVLRFPPPGLLRHLPRSGRWRLMPLPAPCRKAVKESGWPDVIITTGRRMAGLSILLRSKSRGISRTIHIQDPKLPTDLFDLMIIPSHDRLRGDNVLVTTGSLNTLTLDKINTAARALPPEVRELPRPVIAVMIGGTNRRYTVTEPHLLRLGQVASGLGHATGGSLVFIPSRRSHDMAAACISATIGKDLLETPPHWIWDGVSENPYPGILGHADALVVTSDSVNMTSEACLNGKPVYRYHFQEETGRIALFHAIMDEGGYTQPLEPFNVMDFPAPSGPGLDETGRVARLLRGQD